ncbi:hypothetical protein GCM10027072_57850 [Streptomyces bullii]
MTAGPRHEVPLHPPVPPWGRSQALEALVGKYGCRSSAAERLSTSAAGPAPYSAWGYVKKRFGSYWFLSLVRRGAASP